MATAISTPTHGLSAIRSVVSSWATWIQYSCGSLMNIQIGRGRQNAGRGCAGFQRSARPRRR